MFLSTEIGAKRMKNSRGKRNWQGNSVTTVSIGKEFLVNRKISIPRNPLNLFCRIASIKRGSDEQQSLVIVVYCLTHNFWSLRSFDARICELCAHSFQFDPSLRSQFSSNFVQTDDDVDDEKSSSPSILFRHRSVGRSFAANACASRFVCCISMRSVSARVQFFASSFVYFAVRSAFVARSKVRYDFIFFMDRWCSEAEATGTETTSHNTKRNKRTNDWENGKGNEG